MPKLVTDRFFSKIAYSPELFNGTPCWLWQASTTLAGYGMFGDTRGKSVPAHRFAYEFFKDQIPEGLHIDHLCRNRS